MSLELWMSNLWFYSLQTGILILVGGLLPWIFRLRTPGILLRFIWLGVGFYRLHMLSVPMPLETDQESQNV